MAPPNPKQAALEADVAYFDALIQATQEALAVRQRTLHTRHRDYPSERAYRALELLELDRLRVMAQLRRMEILGR